MCELTLPLSNEVVSTLKVGQRCLLTGTLITARDLAHKYLVHKDIPKLTPLLKNAVIYHCGPIVQKLGNRYRFIACGPTTSIREEPYMADLIAKYHLKGIIGKGGMGQNTAKALQKHGCVYFQATGGIAAVLSQRVKKVESVFMLEKFGVPEAIWIIQVEKFPLLVTMDTHGNSLHANISEKSLKQRNQLIGR